MLLAGYLLLLTLPDSVVRGKRVGDLLRILAKDSPPIEP
jgi:hypothetical protein